MLRSGAKSADLDEQRVLAARKRSPQTVSAAPGQSSPPPPPKTANTPALTGPTHAVALRTTATAFDAHRGKAW
ncbi:hypothetical protein [Streptomyces sp. NPDC002172]